MTLTFNLSHFRFELCVLFPVRPGLPGVEALPGGHCAQRRHAHLATHHGLCLGQVMLWPTKCILYFLQCVSYCYGNLISNHQSIRIGGYLVDLIDVVPRYYYQIR